MNTIVKLVEQGADANVRATSILGTFMSKACTARSKADVDAVNCYFHHNYHQHQVSIFYLSTVQ